jgi:hypothetical protein
MTALLLEPRRREESSSMSSSQTTRLAAYPYLVTNDRLHDHTSRLKSTAMFRRLYGCHAVHYRFDRFSNKDRGCTGVHFLPADLFFQKIQVSKCSTAGVSWTGKAWHFPIKRGPANERFVIKIPVKSSPDA